MARMKHRPLLAFGVRSCARVYARMYACTASVLELESVDDFVQRGGRAHGGDGFGVVQHVVTADVNRRTKHNGAEGAGEVGKNPRK